MKGFFNKYLLIDLSSRRSEVYSIDDNILKNLLGGKGLASYLLSRYQPVGVDSLSPQNPFVIGLGPITDTAIFGSSRYGLYTKSPLTGFFCESYSGGKVPEKISRTGFDCIVLVGRSDGLIYLEINDGDVRFHDSRDLAGKDCIETEKLLNERHGKDKGAIVIGPAGERLIPFSIVSNDFWRCAGRAGAGTVMGAKNVKAIVFGGNAQRDVADPVALREFAKETFQRCKDLPVTNAYKNKGTPMMVDLLNNANAFPTRYWHKGFFDGYKNINAEAMQTKMEVKPHACARCFMACGKLSTVKEGEFKGLLIEGPEYETIYAFGGLCMIDDITKIAYINDLCDRLGIDTITTGNLVALAMEASDKGKIKDTYRYGSFDDALTLINDIANRRGIGEILSKGIKEASKALSMESSAIHVKGLEPAGYDPRRLKGMSLAYATSDRGACHLRSTFYKAELSGMIAPEVIEGKAELFIDFEDRLTLMDCLILCRFYRDFYQWDELGKIIHITTGMNLSKSDLKTIAKTVSSSIREYNIKEGMTEDDERIPQRLFDEPLEGVDDCIKRDEFDKLLKDYYSLKGWNCSK
ncbi:MAG: aldehyde ferredoxin oxidoreductase family protein [Thermodesulfovibrionales bacterium]